MVLLFCGFALGCDDLESLDRSIVEKGNGGHVINKGKPKSLSLVVNFGREMESTPELVCCILSARENTGLYTEVDMEYDKRENSEGKVRNLG